MPPLLRIGHKRLAGNFNLTLAGTITPIGALSSGLVEGLVVSDDWNNYNDMSEVQSFYTTGGRTMNIQSGDLLVDGSLVANPLFGKIIRLAFKQQIPFYDLVNAPAGIPGKTPRVIIPFPTDKAAVAVRIIYGFDKGDNVGYGWRTKSPNDPSSFGGGYKLCHLHWRQNNPLGINGERLVPGVYNNTNNLTHQLYVQSGSGNQSFNGGVATFFGGVAGESGLNRQSLTQGVPNPAWEFDSEELCEIIYMFKPLTSTTATFCDYWRRLTSSGRTVLSPGDWQGFKKTGATMDPGTAVSIPLIKDLELGVNKNHGNEYDQFIFWGPYSVYDLNVQANPYNLPSEMLP